MKEKPLIVIGAGGTGGHMFPAAAFAAEMQARGWQVGLISDHRGLRYAKTFPADQVMAVEAVAPDMRSLHTWPGGMLRLLDGLQQIRRSFRANPPDVVAGFGGYASFPALACAWSRRISILIHEQNAVLGRVNRLFARRAAILASGFERLERLPRKVAHMPVGNPVRSPVLAIGDTHCPDNDGVLNLLIIGGSQGAQIFGEIIPLAIVNHLPAPMQSRLRVVQQVRTEQAESVRALYEQAGIQAEIAPFFDDLPQRLADAHLVVARSGAGTISEIAAAGRPSILIPFKAARDDHQMMNAGILVEAGAADLVVEDNLYPLLLGELLHIRLGNGDDLCTRAAAAKRQGRPDAARDLADLAEQVVAA